MAKQFRGVERAQEIQSKTLWRNTKTYSERFGTWVEEPTGFIVCVFFAVGIGMIFPVFTPLALVSGLWICWFANSRRFTLPFRMPANSNLPDYNDPKAGGDEPGKAAGIAYLGNEINSRKELWFKNDDMRTHLLIFGSTGAGKALRMGELVLTPSGWRRNDELTVGEQVVTADGDVSSIEGIFPQGELELWELRFEDGRSATVSGDHLWGARRGHGAQEVLSTEALSALIAQGERIEIPLCAPWGPGIEWAAEKTDALLLAAQYGQFESELWEELLRAPAKSRERVLRLLTRPAGGAGKVMAEQRMQAEEGVARRVQRLAWSLGARAIMEPAGEREQSLRISFPKKGEGYLRVQSILATGKKELCQCIKIKDSRGLFVIQDWVVTHNTEALISIAYNALVHASGFIYVDGKGDSSLFAKIYALARAMGREDDLLVVNYMTGSRDVFGPQSTKLSNTLNPFTSGSSGGLTELLVSLMDDSGGDNAMWKGRAISLISSIMMALVHMREQREILLDVDVIRDYLILENITKLSKRRDLPAHVITAIKAYLKSLPGYQEGAQKQSETVNDQHGYLQMQFTKILGSLADSYGYIFRTNLGEVDFWDVVANRRILVVLLPALEKSPEELANLGKIVVACLKQMMATGLGSLLEGEYRKIIETKPTYAPTPFLCILDEYGYYAVKGAAVMPAQARSLGFSMIFAGQDYPAFEKASKEEAMSTVANCNIKIFMKLEDPKDTFDLFAKLVGEAYVTHVSGYQANTSAMITGYNDMQNANVEKRARGDLLDLKDQREGEAHIIFKSAVIRAQMFYAAPKMPKHLQLNYFLKIEPPDRAEVLEMDSGMEDLRAHLLRPVFMSDLEDSTDSVPDIDLAAKIFSTHTHLTLMERACASVYAHHETVQTQMDAFKTSMGMFMNDEDSEEEERMSIFNGGEDEQFEKAKKKGAVSLDDDDDDFDHPETDEEFPVFMNQDRTQSALERVEQLGGESPEQAAENAQRIVEDMKAISQYPHGDAPEDKSPDDILDMLKELDEKIDELEREDDE